MAHVYSLIAALSLATYAVMTGCSRSDTQQQAAPREYTFTNFGTMPIILENNGSETHSKLGIADFNGDGRPDIVIYDTTHDTLSFYENKMPQKNTNAFERVFERR